MRSLRASFTLVELLIVMTIIAVLIGLSLAGVQQVRGKAKQLQCRSDISQLSAAIAAFQTKYQVGYIPSRIVLKNTLVVWDPVRRVYVSNYDQTPGTAEFESWRFLKKVWPRLQGTTPAVPSVGAIGQVRWFPDDSLATASNVYYLEGDQCLTFFLGGIQKDRACRGFSKNVTEPTNWQGWAANTVAMDAPLFDFPTARTDYAGTPWNSRSAIPRSFLDPWGTPYAYFSSNDGVTYLYGALAAGYQGTSDIEGLAAKYGQVMPYEEPVTAGRKFYNGQSFQIVSAGKDRQFGPGGAWNAATGYGALSPGADDMTDFHALLMGDGVK